MADSRRELLMQAIDARMATITTANGYETNIGLHHFLWKTGDWEADELEGVNIADVEDNIRASTIGTTQEDHHLTVEIIVACKAGAATDAFVRKMIADVYKAIRVDRKFGLSYVHQTWPRGDRVQIQQLGKIAGGAKIKIETIFRTGLFDPYA
ncbi:MAG: hypothetical protein AB1705_14535 [Verrucomicrobiota bacterium]